VEHATSRKKIAAEAAPTMFLRLARNELRTRRVVNDATPESPMRAETLLLATAIAVANIATAAPGDPDSRVHIDWTNLADFSEAKQSTGSGFGREAPEQWLSKLARHLGARAERALPSDNTLRVTFTDVQRAGMYEPWRGPQWDDVRVIKDLYPPRIDLTFTLTDASGAIVDEGSRQLRDPAFLQRGLLNENDPLRFEKRMLDDWVRDEFSSSNAARR
jgi:hypothetical protein